YHREDGLTFKTQKARYNKKTDVIQALTKYVSYMNGNRATGSSIEYNNALGLTKSKNIIANYKLKER
ncbi:MAG: LPS export ABC transporter periplasmic protein LptC, partial [Sulfurimonas sp.]|nr:LPS export ABC transporter periplasmic protein LptC [Sulfurimonas sp.]